MADFDFIEVETEITAIPSEAEEEILKRKIVEDDNPAALLHRFENPRVIAMVVSHMVNDRIKAFELTQAGALSSIIADFEAGGYFTIQGMKAINEKRDLCSCGKMRQKFFTVVADP